MPTIGWLTWHLGWWWGEALDHLEGRTPVARDSVDWPGDAASTLRWLGERHAAWCGLMSRLTSTDLDQPAAFPWPPGSGYTVADTLAWANAELMKNVAEIGQLRMLLRAQHMWR